MIENRQISIESTPNVSRHKPSVVHQSLGDLLHIQDEVPKEPVIEVVQNKPI